MIPRWKQRAAGAVMALFSAGMTAWLWQRAMSEGHYYLRAALLFPACTILGLAMIAFPDYKTERLERGEDISGLRGMQLLTPRWWGVLVLGSLAGCANLYFISR